MVIRTTADNKPGNRCVNTVFAFHSKERNPHINFLFARLGAYILPDAFHYRPYDALIHNF